MKALTNECTCLIFCLFLLLSCNPPDKSASFSSEELEGEIKVMLNNYFKDIAKDGLTAEFKYLDQSSDFFWVPPGYASALSYDSVRSILELRAPVYKSVQFEWASLKVNSLGNDHASYTGIVSGEMIDTTDAKTTVALIESGVIIRRKDGWKLLCGQSAVLPE